LDEAYRAGQKSVAEGRELLKEVGNDLIMDDETAAKKRPADDSFEGKVDDADDSFEVSDDDQDY
jgi:hypothetical protein